MNIKAQAFIQDIIDSGKSIKEFDKKFLEDVESEILNLTAKQLEPLSISLLIILMFYDRILQLVDPNNKDDMEKFRLRIKKLVASKKAKENKIITLIK